MPARPEDIYNPVPSVSPEIGNPSNYLNVRANPEAFGAPAGAALEKAGQTQQQVEAGALDLATQYQGMLNETYATDAETETAKQYSDILGKYKSLEGLAAVNAKDQTIQDLIKVRQTIAASMPNAAARRAYNMLASRRESYALEDIGLYSASQAKVADTRSATASLNLAIDEASDPSVATSDARFGSLSGQINFAAARLLNNQGYGQYISQDPKTGKLNFADSPEGQTAKSVYDEMMSKANGAIWENRIKTLLDDPHIGNANNALAVFDANRDKIPAASQAKIAAMLAAPVRNAQTRQIADGVLSDTQGKYLSSVDENVTGKYSPQQMVTSIIQQESGGKGNNLGQIQPDTWNQFAKPGEDIHNTKDNTAVTQRIIEQYSKEYNGDPLRVAVAYFSGPGNVAPAGSPTPWIKDTQDANGKSVSSYVSDISRRLQGVNNIPYQSQADYYRTNYANIIMQAREKAAELHGDDPTFIDAAASRVEQRMNDVIRQQEVESRADSNLVLQAVDGKFSNGEPLTSDFQLDHASTEVKQAWDRLQIANPLGAEYIKNKLLTANSRGKQVGYGTQFYDLFSKVMSGQVSDPMSLLPNLGDGTKDAPLTVNGFKLLNKEIQNRDDPANVPFQEAELQFFNRIHAEATGQNVYPDLKSPKLEAQFQKNMSVLFNQIQAGIQQGKTATQLFTDDPKNSDYIGKYFQPPKPSDVNAEQFKEVLGQINLKDTKPIETLIGNIQDPTIDIKDRGQFLRGAVDSKVITRDQAFKLGQAYGIFAPASTSKAQPQQQLPQVPTPQLAAKKGTSGESILKQPVQTTEDLSKQWAQLQVSDYDFGKLIQTNPLAYLGYLAVKDQGVASFYKTPVTALGFTVPAKGTLPEDEQNLPEQPLVSQLLKEAGVKEGSEAGHILLGPEMAKGKDTYTLEHELMHRGYMELIKRGLADRDADQESMLRAFQAKYGSDSHSHEDMATFSDLFPHNTKDWEDIKADFAKDAQDKARKIINEMGFK